MASSRINRFFDFEDPTKRIFEGNGLQAHATTISLEQAVAQFNKEHEASPMLQNACIKAKNLLCCGIVGQNLGNLCALNCDSRMAIVAFTMEEPNVYKEFNSESRKLTDSSWSSFPYKGMWLLLNKAILDHGQNSCLLTVYRCTRAMINVSVNTTFCFGQISSTSLDPSVAQGFCNGQGTLFVIETSRCLGIKALSEFPKEEEYILSAFDRFTVMKVDNAGSCRKVFLQEVRFCVL